MAANARKSVAMHLLQVTTAGCICLVFIWIAWLPQYTSSASIEVVADPSVRSAQELFVSRNAVRARKRQNYRQADYDYDEEENEEEEAEEELEAALSGTKIGGGGAEAEDGENNENDDDEEEEDEYDEDEGRAMKRKYLIEKFMRIKL